MPSPTPSSLPETVVIDWKQLDQLTFGDIALKAEVARTFCRQAETLAAELQVNPSEAAAHKLKGSALGIGAPRVVAAIEELEAELATGRDGTAAASLVARQVAEACRELAALCEDS